ncbi:hypothetical protein [Propionivibrio sp.]|uniref:hypothetical protein n=1 Tax=Propionivibrio sp. TaxID=2212460 RepID=UPI003BF12798
MTTTGNPADPRMHHWHRKQALSPDESKARRRSVEDGWADLCLEGLNTPPDLVALSAPFIRGDLRPDLCRTAGFARAKSLVANPGWVPKTGRRSK